MKRQRPGYGRGCNLRDDGGVHDRTDQAKRFAPFGLPLGDLAVPLENGQANVVRHNWVHTVVLHGDLDRYSAATLEAEIERLCNRGVASLTLDLSQLSSIDVTGVAVISYRCAWCMRRGCEFALIEGPEPIQRIFELVGVAARLPFVQPDTDPLAARLQTRATADLDEMEPARE